MFEWNPDHLPVIKLGLHIAQMVFAFVIFCLEISVVKAPGAFIVGDNGWTLGVCFLSIPAWIYLCMAPRFPRTRKLANPHAMAVIDALYTVFWLSAFATQAAYNTANLCGTACGQSKAIVGLGFFNCLFFAGTTFLSVYTVKYYEWNGELPGYDKSRPPRTHTGNIDPDKAAFSMAPHDEEAYAPVGMSDHDHDHDHDHQGTSYGGGGYGRADGYGPSADNTPYHRDAVNPFETQTDYRPATHQQQPHQPYAPPAPTMYEDQPAQFPAGNYDRAVR